MATLTTHKHGVSNRNRRTRRCEKGVVKVLEIRRCVGHSPGHRCAGLFSVITAPSPLHFSPPLPSLHSPSGRQNSPFLLHFTSHPSPLLPFSQVGRARGERLRERREEKGRGEATCVEVTQCQASPVISDPVFTCRTITTFLQVTGSGKTDPQCEFMR